MRTWTCTLIVTFFAAANATAAEPVLTGVKTARSGTAFATELSFDSPVDPKTVKFDFINETIQINVPGVRVEPKRLFTKVDDQKVRSVFTYQSDKDLLRSRVIYKKGMFADQFKNGIKVTALGATLRVEVSEDIPKPEVAAVVPVPAAADSVLSPKLAFNVPPRSLDVDDTPTVASTDKTSPSTTSESPEKTDRPVTPDQPVVDPAAAALEQAAQQTSQTDKAGTEDKKESEIPVLTEAAKTKTADASPVKPGPVAGGLVILLIVMAGSAYYFRGWYRGKAGKRPAAAIKVIAQHHLGPKKNLAIIKVAGETILIGVTDNNVNLIKTLALIDEEEIPEETPKHFASTLKRSLAQGTGATASPAAAAVDDDDVEEEFSLKGLREIVKNRLQKNSHNAGDMS